MTAGFFLNVLAINVYIVPLFSYIGQLARLNKEIEGTFVKIKSKLLAGPGNWLTMDMLHTLKEFGFPV